MTRQVKAVQRPRRAAVSAPRTSCGSGNGTARRHPQTSPSSLPFMLLFQRFANQNRLGRFEIPFLIRLTVMTGGAGGRGGAPDDLWHVGAAGDVRGRPSSHFSDGVESTLWKLVA